MNNPGLPSSLWNALDGGLWHATSPAGLKGILQDGEIRVFRDRYLNSLCKKLCGVSLMDFGASASDRPGQFRNWSGWFGHQQDCRVAVWIEINRQTVSSSLLNAEAARALLSKGNHGRQLIPGVEACHRGAIPATALAGILCVDRHDQSRSMKVGMAHATTCIEEFETGLPTAPPESPLLATLRKRSEAAAKRSSRETS